MTTLPPEIKVPTIWYKAQRAIRTVVQFLIIAVPLANTAAGLLIEYLRTQEGVPIPAWVFLVLNGIVLGAGLLAGIVSRIMSIPGVNDWLTKWLNLGSVPKSALVPVPAAADAVVVPVEDDTTVVVKPDPHVFPAG